MARLLEPLEITDLLRESSDQDYYQNRFALRAWAVGDKIQKGMVQTDGILPDYPDLFPMYYEPGQSQKALVNWVLMLSKIAYYDPEPDFPDLDGVQETVRQEIIKSLWRDKGNYGKREFGPQVFRAFMDTEGLGTGWVQIDSQDGNVFLRHHRLENVLWDKHSNSPSNARFVAFIHNLSPEEAESRFGSRVNNYVQQMPAHYGQRAHDLRRVRVIELWSTDMGKKNASHAFILGDLGGPILDIEENTLGCIPAAHGEMFPIPGVSRAMGRLEMQKATQEMRNALERYITLTLKRGSGFDIMNTEGLNQEDLRALQSGMVLPLVRYEGTDDQAIGNRVARLPAQDIPSGVFNYYSMVDRDQSPESGNSDADRSNLTQRNRTLGEVQQMQAGADIQSSWSARQYTRFLERIIEKTVVCAREWQRAPLPIKVFGQSINLNDPQEPNSAIETWLSEKSRVIVSEDQVQYRDTGAKMQEAINFYSLFLQDPYVDPMVVRRKIFEARGEKNPDEFFAGVQNAAVPTA